MAVMLRKLLRSPENSGGGGVPSGDEQRNAEVVPPNAPPPSNPSADPAAAKTVIEGTKTEADLALAQQLEAEKAARKKEQVRISELENENHRLKQIPGDQNKKPRDAMSEFFGWKD
jgi:hypothetical protein